MLSDLDQKRLRRLYQLQMEGRLGEFVREVGVYARERGVSRQRDALDGPDVTLIRQAHHQVYPRPLSLNAEEILYEMFPSLHSKLADELLFDLLA